MTVRLDQQSAGPEVAGALCAICQTPIAAGERMGPCPSCASPFHVPCWEENGGCATYGCQHMPVSVKEEAAAEPAAFWGQEEKSCPACHQRIRVAALRCKHCGSIFASADPGELRLTRIGGPAPAADVGPVLPRRSHLHPTEVDASVAQGRETAALLLLVFGVIPCTGPLAFLVGGIWYLSGREEIAQLSPQRQMFIRLGLVAGGISTAIVLLILAVD